MTTFKDMLFDRFRFFYSFLRSPRMIGSITPSSHYLTAAMLRGVDWNQIEMIVELGAGTGVFTRQLNQLVKSGTRVLIFEQERRLRELLMARYPNFDYEENACHLMKALKFRNIGEVDVILSGLPFAAFPQSLRDEIMVGVYEALKPGGVFVAFQYSLQMKKQFQNLFHKVELSFVPWNIPPAVVYRCHK